VTFCPSYVQAVHVVLHPLYLPASVAWPVGPGCCTVFFQASRKLIKYVNVYYVFKYGLSVIN